MWQELLIAVGLLLVIEGVLPFLSPATTRRALLRIAQMNETMLRFAGLTSMVAGCLLLYFVNA